MPEQQCFLSVACLTNTCSSTTTFSLCPAWRHRKHFYCQSAFLLFIHYMPLYLLIFWAWIHYLITQNMIMGTFEHWRSFIRLTVSGKIANVQPYRTRRSGVISLTCDWMEMMINDVKRVSCWQRETLPLSLSWALSEALIVSITRINGGNYRTRIENSFSSRKKVVCGPFVART